MTKKTIKLTEKQLQMLTETRINEVTAIDIANVLKTIGCTGESIKKLISSKSNPDLCTSIYQYLLRNQKCKSVPPVVGGWGGYSPQKYLDSST